MFPASLAAWVPVFMATPTSACASAGASLVPSPVMATRLPPACSALMRAILSSGVASARKSSTPASAAIAAAVSGLSPVIITVRMPMARSSSKRSVMPGFTVSLRWMTPSTRGGSPGAWSNTTSGVPPSAATPSTMRTELERHRATLASATQPPAPSRRRPCGPAGRRAKSMPDMRVWAVKGTMTAPVGSGGASPNVLGRQLDDRATLGRLVGQRRRQRGLGDIGARSRRGPGGTRRPGGCRR